MTREEFDALDDQLLTRADEVLRQKRGAYADEVDVLSNFKALAAESGLPVARVWEVLMRKAINALVRTVAGQDLGGEPAIDRPVDMINYVRLGWAIANQHATPNVANVTTRFREEMTQGVRTPFACRVPGCYEAPPYTDGWCATHSASQAQERLRPVPDQFDQFTPTWQWRLLDGRKLD